VVIVAGDSDYIALAQRAKRLGRYVVGIGVAGGTSKALAGACDEFADYDDLPGIAADLVGVLAADLVVEPPAAPARPADAATTSNRPPASSAKAANKANAAASASGATGGATGAADAGGDALAKTGSGGPSNLLVRALRLGRAKGGAEWINSSALKSQMLRMDASFDERELGFTKFTDFLKSRGNIAEVKEDGVARLVRLRPSYKSEG
jgi:Uncharacterized conserved protein